MRLAAESVPDLGREVRAERPFGRSARLVLLLALLLIALSALQKAYRLSLPTDGWSTTNADFGSDDPVYLKNLAGKPSPLRGGDRLVALEGVPFLELELRSPRGQATGVGYEAGRTVRYTVVRAGREIDLPVPLYPGSSVGPGKVLPLLYGLPLAAFALMFALPEGSGAPLFGVVGLYNLLGIAFVVRLFFVFKDPVGRAQVRWFGFGYAVSNLGTLLFALWAAGLVPDGVNRVTEALPFNLVFLLCTGVALLRYRLFDIDLILGRTLVWGG